MERENKQVTYFLDLQIYSIWK